MENDYLDPLQGSDSVFSDTVKRDSATYMNNLEIHRPALDLLMDNYGGLPDMIQALVGRANNYIEGKKNLKQAVKNVLLEHEATIVPKLDEALVTTKRSLPVVSDITSSNRWNQVVSAMAARNKKSTLHNLLTKETRLSQAGTTQNVVSPSETFVQAKCQQISDVLANGKPVSETDLLELYECVAIISPNDDCIFMTALRALDQLSREALDHITRTLYRRLSQEVRREAINVVASISIVPEHVERQYIIRLPIFTDFVADNVSMRSQAADALLGVLSRDMSVKRRYEAETLALRNVYGALTGDFERSTEDEAVETVVEFDCSVEEKMVLNKPLCHCEVFQDALTSLCSHEHRTYVKGKPDEGKRKCLSILLAYAGVFIAIGELDFPESLSNEHEKESLRYEVKNICGRMKIIAKICGDLKPGCPEFKTKRKPAEILLSAVKHSLLEHGVLIWTREGLQEGSDLKALLATTPRHFPFLVAIAKHCEFLRGQVLKCTRQAFMREYSGLDIIQQEELRGKLMKSIMGMVRVQMGPLIVDMFPKKYFGELRVDRNHFQYILSGLSEAMSPFYSPQFAENVLTLLSSERIASAVNNDGNVNRLVRTFKEQLLRWDYCFQHRSFILVQPCSSLFYYHHGFHTSCSRPCRTHHSHGLYSAPA